MSNNTKIKLNMDSLKAPKLDKNILIFVKNGGSLTMQMSQYMNLDMQTFNDSFNFFTTLLN